MKKQALALALLIFVSINLTAQVIPGNSFKGLYFGTFSNGDTFGLVVSKNSDASIFIVGTVSKSAGLFTNFAISSSGGFSITQNGVSIIGSIAQGIVSGTVPQKGETLSGSLVSQTGSSQTYQGYYLGTGRDSLGNQNACFFVVSSAGQVLFYITGATVTNGAIGSIDSSGNLALTAATGGAGSGAFSTPLEGGGYSGTVNISGIGNISFTVSRKDVSYKLANISTRGIVGTGNGALIAGFVISGGAKTVLIRAAGPALQAYGVTGVLVDPQISVFNSAGAIIAQNDDWGSSAVSSTDMIRIFNYVYAFPFSAGSKDSATVLNLEPGAYTAQVSGVGGSTGAALVEVYDVQ